MRERIEQVRGEIATLRETLLPAGGPAPEPETIAGRVPALEHCAAVLGEILRELEAQSSIHGAAQRSELVGELEALGRELHRAGKLIGHGALINDGWARVLAMAAGGYTRAGEAWPLEGHGTVAIDG